MLRPYGEGANFGDQAGDLGFVGVAHDVGDAREGGELFGGALGVAAGNDDAGSRVVSMKLTDGVTSLGVGGSGYGASIQDHDVGRGGGASWGAATVEELAFDGGPIGLGGAAAELLNIKGRHRRGHSTVSGLFGAALGVARAAFADGPGRSFS